MASKLNARRKTILDLLSQKPISPTQELAAATDVSTETTRKDLNVLAEQGLIVKVHGGAALASGNNKQIPFDLRSTRNAPQKRQIAQKAITLIEEGDSLILEGCTTNLKLAEELTLMPDLLKTLVIVTNSFPIATVLEGGRKCQKLFFLGGLVNPTQYATQGNQTTEMLGNFHVNKSFLGGAAVSERFILTGYFDDDVMFQKMSILCARETVLMVDSSKFGQSAILSVAHLSEIDYLVTDKQLTEEETRILTEHGLKILLA